MGLAVRKGIISAKGKGFSKKKNIQNRSKFYVQGKEKIVINIIDLNKGKDKY